MVRSRYPIALVLAFVLGLAVAGFGQAGFQPAWQAEAAAPVGAPVGAYAAEVVRVIDGDTVEARVRVWLGQEITTRVRLAGVDAPELRRPACAGERAEAEAAREALAGLVERRPVLLSHIRPDKYFGRVVARMATAAGDVSDRLIADGHGQTYSGRGRRSWCG